MTFFQGVAQHQEFSAGVGLRDMVLHVLSIVDGGGLPQVVVYLQKVQPRPSA